MTFKVGDRARFVQTDTYLRDLIGCEGVVVKITGGGLVYWECSDHSSPYRLPDEPQGAWLIDHDDLASIAPTNTAYVPLIPDPWIRIGQKIKAE